MALNDRFIFIIEDWSKCCTFIVPRIPHIYYLSFYDDKTDIIQAAPRALAHAYKEDEKKKETR